MGNTIDKNLAILETFLTDDEQNGQLSEDELPRINRSQLVQYAWCVVHNIYWEEIRKKFGRITRMYSASL